MRVLSKILLGILFVTCAANAQVLYGTLTGNVTDPSGAVVPGAKVGALNIGTGLSRESVTDNRGSYTFSNLQAGAYKITVRAGSFQPVAQDNVAVSLNEVRRAD